MPSPAVSYNKQLILIKHLVQPKDQVTDELDKKALDNLQAVLVALDSSASSEAEKLKSAILEVKKTIAQLETHDQQSMLLKNFRDNGLYRILYRNSTLKGIDSTDILPNLLKDGSIGIGISAIVVALFAAISILTVPAWITVSTTALFSAAMTYLSAISYGVINDLFATRSNLPYFLLGHQPQQHSLLRTNDPVAQGVAWGIAATFGPAVLAAIAFGVATLITASFAPFATFLFPIMLIAMPLIAYGADRYAKKKAKEYEENGIGGFDLDNFDFAYTGLNAYQIKGLKLMSTSKEEKASWFANSDRNMFGFTKMPLIGLGVLVGAITLSALSASLPAILFSATMITVLPVSTATLAILFLATMGTYTYKNRNTQIDNRFKLAFDNEQTFDNELYLDEVIDMTQEINMEVPRHQPSVVEEPRHFDSPIGFGSRAIVSRTQEVDMPYFSLTP